MEEYAGHFLEVARRSATEKTCLLVFFWGGLAEPFMSRMPYWVQEESLEDYINLALSLSGLAFSMELAAVPAHVTPEVEASTHKAPEAAGSADVSSEVAELASGLLETVEAADISSNVAEFTSGLLEAV